MKKVIPIFISLGLIIISCLQKEKSEQYPVLGLDSLQLHVLEEPDEALKQWSEKEIEESTLIHVSPYGAFAGIPHHTVKKLMNIIKEKKGVQFRDSREKFFNHSNYLYAAMQLGMVNRIFWVIPYRLFEDLPLAGEKIKEFIHESDAGFDKTEIDEMKMVAGCLAGNISDAEVYICSPRTLPEIREPALLTIDVSFFPVYASEARISKLRALKWFFDYMTLRRTFRVKHASISYSMESGYTDAIHLYIGEELVEGMGNPHILKSDSPPELWQLRDQAENMLSGGEDELVEEFLTEPLLQYPDDPALRFLGAVLKVRLKHYDQALTLMDDLCKGNKRYCYGYVYLAGMIDEKEKEWENIFMRKALDALPESNYVREKSSSLVNQN